MKKILFFPLYAGELGWELMVWQGLLRKAAQDFDEVHGVCFEPFKHLYEDFTDKLYFETPTERFLEPRHEISPDIEEKIKELVSQEDTEVNLCDAVMTIAGAENCKEGSIYKSYKQNLKKKYDAVLHLRNMEHRPEDNGDPKWNKKLINRLLSEGKKIALIGTSKGSCDVDFPVDKFYDKPLSEVIKVINQSKVVIGPSSGPMHLAALCEAEIIVWHNPANWDIAKVSKRYTEHWNPFNNKVNYLTEPSVEDIVKLVTCR